MIDATRVVPLKGKTPCYRTTLRVAMDVLLDHDLLPAHAADTRRWNDRVLVMTALLMGYDDAAAAGDRFDAARGFVVEAFPGRRRPGTSYNGFTKALARFGDAGRLDALHAHLRTRMRGLLGRQWATADGRGDPWVVLAVDGTRVDAPDTAADEAGLGSAGRTKSGPQMQLTTVFHLASGVPYCWRCSPVGEGERSHLLAMADLLPPRTLLVADAGFAGYGLVKRLLDAGRDLLMRVGGNVALLADLGYDWRQDGSTVYLWPGRERARAGRDLDAGREPDAVPLVMRLVVLHERVGREVRSVYLLTNVRCRRRLSDARAGRIYRRRWVAETAYRGLKQTMERRKVCSRTPGRALLEVEWAMLSLWFLGLLSVREKARCGRDVGAWSVAASLRVVRDAMGRPWAKSPNGGVLGELRRAAKDAYERTSSKRARRRRDKKRDRPPGPPNARKATRAEKALAQRVLEQRRAA